MFYRFYAHGDGLPGAGKHFTAGQGDQPKLKRDDTWKQEFDWTNDKQDYSEQPTQQQRAQGVWPRYWGNYSVAFWLAAVAFNHGLPIWPWIVAAVLCV